MTKSRSSTKSVCFIAVLCVIAAALVAWIVVSAVINKSGDFTSSAFKKAISEYFGKPASAITDEDFATIKVLVIDDSQKAIVVGGTELYDAIETNLTAESADQVSYDDLTKTIAFTAPVNTFEDYKRFTGVKYIGLSNCNSFESVDQLQAFGELEHLYLSSASVTKLSGIENLKMLKAVFADGCKLEDPEVLGKVENLKYLTVSSCGLKTLSFLDGTDLIELSASKNELTDLAGLANMASIEHLDVSSNKLTDISALSGKNNLEALDLSSNEELSDVSALAGSEKLDSVNATGCAITDITGLGECPALESLNLSSNKDLADLAPLSALENLTSLDTTGCAVVDVSPVGKCVKLDQLMMGDNKIEDISGLSTLTKLTYLQLEDNDIKSVKPIAGLEKLTYVVLTGNENVADWEELDGLTNASVVGRPETEEEETAEATEEAEITSEEAGE